MNVEAKTTVTITFDTQAEEISYRRVMSADIAHDLLCDIYYLAAKRCQDPSLGEAVNNAYKTVLELITDQAPSTQVPFFRPREV